MRLKIRNMKFINSRVLLLLAIILSSFTAAAQEIIKETPRDTVKPKLTPGRAKVDGVVAVVGDYVVLDSDIDMMYREMQAQNMSTKDVTRCELLSRLMEEKLFAHQAIQDSIVVTDAEVNSMMEERINYFVEAIGSQEKMVKYFKKKNIEAFRTDLFDMLKSQRLTEQMQRKIFDDVTITPEEVRQFYNSIKSDLPVFGAEMEIAQIVIKPEVTQEAKQTVIDRLRQIKADVQNGSSFYSKAVLYTEDRASASSGGFIKMNRKSPLVKEFKEVAFSTEEGQISEPFETQYGYHIIYVEKIRGQDLDVRHILISPKVSDADLKKAKDKIDLIRQRIVSGEISFADAARSESDEKETRNSGGLLMNPRTLETRFELTKIDPKIYAEIQNLKDREVTMPILDDDPGSGQSYKIMTVMNRYDEHTADYALDYTKIKDLALREKQKKAIAKWTDQKIKETYVKIAADYKNCQFGNHWVK
jgi:peptidyl-prolyl cis-trans isomerase SurA